MSSLALAKQQADDARQAAIQHTEKALREAREALARKLRDAERAVIQQVVASAHRGLAQWQRVQTDGRINLHLHQARRDWNAYADIFEDSAKGQWASGAHRQIATASEQLLGIADR